jgi:hypothetical protein
VLSDYVGCFEDEMLEVAISLHVAQRVAMGASPAGNKPALLPGHCGERRVPPEGDTTSIELFQERIVWVVEDVNLAPGGWVTPSLASDQGIVPTPIQVYVVSYHVAHLVRTCPPTRLAQASVAPLTGSREGRLFHKRGAVAQSRFVELIIHSTWLVGKWEDGPAG